MSLIPRTSALMVAMALALGPTGVGRAAAAPPPVAVADAYSINEDQVLTVDLPGVLDNDTPLDGTYCVVAFDEAELEGSLTGTFIDDGSFEFTPTANWNGETTFAYDMAAGTPGSCPGQKDDTATVTITVVAVNDKPILSLGSTCGSDVNVDEDSGQFSDTDGCVNINWGGGESQAVAGWVVSTNRPELFSSGPTITTYNLNKGRLAFTPAANANGVATVTVQVRDDGGTANDGVNLSTAIDFTITVAPVNDAPTAAADSFIVLKDRTLLVGVPGVLINDADIDSASITADPVSGPSHGVLFLLANGSFSYTPAAGYEGPDAFSYRASDGASVNTYSPTRVVSLTVTSIPPVNTPTPFPTPSGTPLATPGETFVEPSPSASADASASIDPFASASPIPSAVASALASPSASAPPDPGPTGDGGGISLPVLLVVVLFVLLIGFGAALYVPKWLAAQRTGGPIDPD